MNTLNIEHVRFPEAIQSPYLTCKYLERLGISLDNITLGNVHKCIEKAVDDNQLPITQVITENHSINNQQVQNLVEGYLIGV
ncbi:hypothetical protein [uncultured Methanobrevibacter sp.]|uniref:hypothetical protein n=1 Tax=uncultured Methanobrevibacter sp. TaxID=253161 RepID=UPI0025E8F33D|nr:hypothetical protein [uncultured Methanobrevibacter sp.]